MMALADVTNKWGKAYEIRFSVDPKFAPLIKRGLNIDLQTQKKSFSTKREEGCTNLDLWIDGGIYPRDPRTNLAPPFTNLKELVVFFCLGKNGFYGYAQSLAQEHDRTREREEHALAIKGLEIDKSVLLKDNLQSRVENLGLLAKIRSLGDDKEQMLERITELEESLARQIQVVQDLNLAHRRALQGRSKVFASLRYKYEKLLRDGQVRKRKNLTELSQTGGHAKKLKRQVRSLLQASTTKQAQEQNAASGTKQHFCGDVDAQRHSAILIASMLTKREKEYMVQQPNMTTTIVKATNNLLTEVGDHVQASDMLAACDTTGVSQKGFAAIRKTLKNGFKVVHPQLKLAAAVPSSHQVTKLRTEYNANLSQLIGDYKSLHMELPDAPTSKKAKTTDGSKPKKILLSDKNSLFVDLEVVQKNMVNFYGITKEEIGEAPLLFVLKLDEAEIVKNQKFERVSITLMNRALDSTILHDDPRYFSVQSDRDIWPVACFEVAKESHAQLKYIFGHTSFPMVIEAQEAGKLLQVPGMGEYKVEWHLTADMKTIKCMYGLQHGANAKHSCIYCLQEKSSKEALGSDTAAKKAAKLRQQPSWKGGLFSTCFGAEPSRGTSTDVVWDPIFAIPLTRVHICTLHANVRMVEKILHLHFMFVWNMQNKGLQVKVIQEMEDSLSSAGVHGGNVRIFKDPNLSGSTGSVPNRPSMNGAHVARLFKRSSSSDKEKVWMDICAADNHNGQGGKLSRMRMWKAYEELQPYLTGLTLTASQRVAFKDKIENWGRLYIEAFGEHHVTHYMHVLVRHAPWFVDKYGSLSVWSSQGMEKSHSSAKSAYQRHTQHGGTKNRTSPVVQTFQHWYRIIQHRENSKLKLAHAEDTISHGVTMTNEEDESAM